MMTVTQEDIYNAIILVMMARLGIKEISLEHAEILSAIAKVTDNFAYGELFVGMDKGKMTARIQGS